MYGFLNIYNFGGISMEEKIISIDQVAKELGLYIKIVASVKIYESYNIIYNIHNESEEYCRRVVVLTKYKDLEEVYDEEPSKELSEVFIKDGSAWIKTYPLITRIENINPKKIYISKMEYNRIKKALL